MAKGQRYQYIVVGAGMMGTAAARHLSESCRGVALIGSPEPVDRESHEGVFGSHYDESRIVRTLDTDEHWGLFAARSLARFRDLEGRSGVSFYREVGHLAVSPIDDDPANYCNRVDRVAVTVPASYERLDRSALERRFPYLKVPPGHGGRYQSTVGGYIDPRALVRAQITVATDQGAQYLPRLVTRIRTTSRSCAIETEGGLVLEGEKVLVAAGAFANRPGLLPKALDLSLMGRTVLYLELGERDLNQMAGMPSIICRPAEEDLRSYILPPARYPDGRHYLKIGSSLEIEDPLENAAAAAEWFRSSGNPAVAKYLAEIVQKIFPTIEPLSTHTKTCVNAYATGKLPYIEKMPGHNIYLLAGMNGGSAKSSDEYGFIAAQMLRHEEWHYDVPSDLFCMTRAS